MYTIEIFKEGIQYLGITDPDEILYIINARYENKVFLYELEARKIDKYAVPRGLPKTKLRELLKETQQKIYEIRDLWRNPKNNDITKYFYEEMMNKWIEKKRKINDTMKFHGKKPVYDIKKAKQYPIEKLIEFNHSRFAKCLWHDEKTPSLHLDTRRNKAHCFSCGKDADSIDVYQTINNITTGEAIKALCQIQ